MVWLCKFNIMYTKFISIYTWLFGISTLATQVEATNWTVEPGGGNVVKYEKFWNTRRTQVFNNVSRNFVGTHYHLSVPLFASFFPCFWNKRNDEAPKMDTQENLVSEPDNFVTNKKAEEWPRSLFPHRWTFCPLFLLAIRKEAGSYSDTVHLHVS